jgi:NifU-like protein
MIAQVKGEEGLAVTPHQAEKAKPMTNIEKIAKIQEVMDKEIRPALQKDGGDLELVDVDGNRVMVALRGMCTSCPSAQFTLKLGIEDKLKELVHPDLSVEEVKA